MTDVERIRRVLRAELAEVGGATENQLRDALDALDRLVGALAWIDEHIIQPAKYGHSVTYSWDTMAEAASVIAAALAREEGT